MYCDSTHGTLASRRYLQPVNELGVLTQSVICQWAEVMYNMLTG